MEEEKRSGLLKAGIIESAIIIVLIVVIVGILSYLKVIPIGKLIPHFSVPTFNNQPGAPSASGTKATVVGIACPVNFQDCKNAIYTKYNNQSAALFSIPKNYGVYAVGNLLSVSTDVSSIGKETATVIKTPFIFNNSCYTATYILHHNSTINKITQVPLPKGSVLALVTDTPLTLEDGNSFNVLVQLQKNALDPDKNKPDAQRCTIAAGKDQQANYVDLSSSTFN